jgi:hypothetical protein
MRMNMRSIFQQIGDRFRRDRRQEQPEYSDEVLAGFLRVLEEARVEDVPCEQVYARLDEYVESEVHGQDVSKLMPLLREHLDMCPECCEEYEALLDVLEKSARDAGAA